MGRYAGSHFFRQATPQPPEYLFHSLALPLTDNITFYLERINVGSKTSLSAAEEGVILLEAFEGTSDKYEKAKSNLDGARNLYLSFIQDGLLTDDLISAALHLAHLEGICRSGSFSEADLVRF